MQSKEQKGAENEEAMVDSRRRGLGTPAGGVWL
jgi:hypothetical protein